MNDVDLSGSWVLDPLALAVVGVVAAILHARHRSGGGRLAARDGWLVAGAAVLVLALVSPVAGLAGEWLAAHMIQHLLLVVVAPPLIAAGDPGPAVLTALPGRARTWVVSRWRSLPPAARRPGIAVVAGGLGSAVALWVWHLPSAHTLAVEQPFVHLLEHLTLFVPAVVFWGAVVRRRSRHRQLVLAIVLTSAGLVMAGGVLGALLTFAPEQIYPVYAAGGAAASGLTDQQLAGALLWVAGGPAYAAAAAVAIVRAVGASEDLAGVPRGRGPR